MRAKAVQFDRDPQDTQEILSATMDEIWLRRITALRSVVGIKRLISSRVET